MKKLLILLILGTCTLAYADGQDTTDYCALENKTFAYGEDVTYKVYYNWRSVWMGAGTVDFNIDQAFIDGKEMYHVKAFGKTYRTYDWFFKVRDTYETYLDKETLKSERFVRNVNEGGFTIFNQYDFDREEQRVKASRKDTKKPDLRTDMFDVGTCTQDILAAIYQARLIDFSQHKKGSRIPVDIFIDDKIYNMSVLYEGKERIEVDGETWDCIKFSPQLLKGNYFDTEEGMHVWVSDDKNKMPVLIESPLVVGSVKAIVKDYKGLKHPVTALVD